MCVSRQVTAFLSEGWLDLRGTLLTCPDHRWIITKIGRSNSIKNVISYWKNILTILNYLTQWVLRYKIAKYLFPEAEQGNGGLSRNCTHWSECQALWQSTSYTFDQQQQWYPVFSRAYTGPCGSLLYLSPLSKWLWYENALDPKHKIFHNSNNATLWLVPQHYRT